MTTPSEETLQDLHKELVEERFWRRLVIKVVLIGVAWLTVLSVGVLVSGYYFYQKLDEGNDRIIDCTVPSGQCYKDAEARTNEAVLKIIQAIQEGRDPNALGN
jgi:hypothetical protein